MESNLEDRISTLPDDILALIISDLKLREAGRMSILSRRWRYIWTYTTGILDFERPVFKCEAARCRFIDWVNLVLDRHQGRTIDEFRVCYNLYERNSDAVNSWIKFALKKNVKRLVLQFRNVITTMDQEYAPYFEDYGSPFDNYVLTTQAFSNFSASLTVLHLNRIRVTGEVLEYVLSRFPLLQVLDVKFSRTLVELKIAGPLPNLKRLEIVNCNSIRYLEVHAINLVSFTFTYDGPWIRVIFVEAPHLVEANLGGTGFRLKNLHWFSSHCYCLESLLLDCTKLYSMSFHAPFEHAKFEKLKHLEVSFPEISIGDYIVFCGKLLKASPSLQKCVLKIYGIKKTEDNWTKERRIEIKCLHEQLKVVEFVGYSGRKNDVILVRCFVNRLPRLEKVIVVPQLDPGRDIRNCQQRLQRLLRPGLELVIPSFQNSDQYCN